MDVAFIFYLLLFVVAFLYASVGHGGASGYLALMALFGVAPTVMKPTALMLNLFVSLTAFIQYYRAGHFSWRIFWPLAVASMPFAYLGGLVSIEASVYKKILGLLLLLPVVRFLFFKKADTAPLRTARPVASAGIGAGIGWLSGLIGIGGGIILSPVLLLLKWTNQKQTAAISALFIFVNSLAGLLGQWQKGISFTPAMSTYVALAFAGGLAGAYVGAIRLPQQAIRYALATVLAVASFKLIFTTA
ncbi:MAG: sulfite exporter TauE/SafE family protein [Chitinophagaceae bacterium]|nr:sulfite exporter TauE/SafE family protein [Chitinophagaceae bacterium]